MAESELEALRKFSYVIVEECFRRGIPVNEETVERNWSNFLECGTLKHFFYERMGYKELDYDVFHRFFNLHKAGIINRCKYLSKKDKSGRKEMIHFYAPLEET